MNDHAEVFRMKTEDRVSLSENMLIEVLIYLPIKSLMRFKCISKYWCDLIKSPTFVSRHLKRDCKKTLLVKSYSPLCNGGRDDVGGDDVLSFHDPDDPEMLVSSNISFSIFKELFDVQWARYLLGLHGPCNGIICLDTLGGTVFCNPALREFSMLDPSPFGCPEGYDAYMYESGFGFDANTNSYKFIKMRQIFLEEDMHGNYEEWMRIDLYDSSTNSWKIIDAEVPVNKNFPKFDLLFNGAYHWNAPRWNATHFNEELLISGNILSFNMSNEVFQEYRFPWFDDKKYPNLVVLNQCLAIIRHGGYYFDELTDVDIWIMKEYGVEESWTKELVIGPYLFTRPFLCLRNEWLFVETKDGQLASCALHKNEIKRFQFPGKKESFRAVLFSESLVSVDQEFGATTKISLDFRKT